MLISSSLRGAAPIQRALLAGDIHFGVSVQTLHPDKIDHGIVLAQTPRPGYTPIHTNVEHSCPELYRELGASGARMLVDVIRQGLFVHPHEHQICHQPESGSLRSAPKITTKDTEVDWENWSAADISRRLLVLGSLSDETTYAHCDPNNEKKRVKIRRLLLTRCEAVENRFEPGVPVLLSAKSDAGVRDLPVGELTKGGIDPARFSETRADKNHGTREELLVVPTKEGLMWLRECTVAGEEPSKGIAKLARLWKKKHGEPFLWEDCIRQSNSS